MKVKKEEIVCNTVTVGVGRKQTTKEVCHTKHMWEIVDSDYTLQDTMGCTCYDILEVKKGEDRLQKETGCKRKVIEDWIQGKGSSITWAR